MNLAVIIPAFNAAATLPRLLDRTAAIVPASNIIIVDDGSTDTTADIVARYSVQLIRHERNAGKGAALQTGFTAALQNNFDAVITMDADLQHQPEDIPRFVQMFDLTNDNIIIGSRLHNKKGMPLHRILSNSITTYLVGARTGKNITDSQSGFRFITANVLYRVTLVSNGFEAETEFLIKAASCGFSFGALPIDTIYAGEKSHMTHVATTMNFIKVLFRQY
jgi:glycosyltransferase involved in cell wall biosynthesis